MAIHEEQLRCDDGAPRHARMWVADILDAVPALAPPWRACLADDVVLCASELVSASLLGSSTSMALRLTVDRAYLRMSLVDNCQPAGGGPGPTTRAQRFALEMVERVADSWGMHGAPGGREIWALFLTGTTAEFAP